MIEVKRGLDKVANRERWAARGASFMAKVKATKVVWFPPEPVKSGQGAASSATKATKQTAGKATGKSARKATGAGKKAAGGAKKKAATAKAATAKTAAKRTGASKSA